MSDAPELLALLVHLRALQGGTLPATNGHLVHGAFMTLLQRTADGWVDRLHDPDVQDRPFTLSGLRGGNRGERQIMGGAAGGRPPVIQIEPGRSYWLRITSLQQDLSTALQDLLARPLEPLNLGRVRFQITHIASRSHDRAAAATYREMADSCLGPEAKPFTLLGLKFLSATTFKQDGRNVLFPQPALVFPQLLRRWNLFSPPECRLEALAAPIWEAHLMVSGYHLSTRNLNFGSHGQQLGFTGYCEYRAKKSADPQVLRCINLLWRFAFFAGIGYGTPKGMGQVAPVAP